MRIGGNVVSPLIPVGTGDAIVSLEAIETLRYIEYLKDGGVALMSSKVLHPVTDSKKVVTDKGKSSGYFGSEEVEKRFRQITPNVFAIDALGMAVEAGNALAENSVLLGALSVLQAFPIDSKSLRDAIGTTVPTKAKEANLKAFELGAKASYGRFCDSLPCKKP